MKVRQVLCSLLCSLLLGATCAGNDLSKRKLGKKKPIDEVGFSWMEGTWYSCASRRLFNLNGEVSRIERKDCSGSALLDVNLLENDDANHVDLKFGWPERCVGLGLSERACPELPLPDGCDDIVNEHISGWVSRPGFTGVEGTFYGTASFDPTKQDEMTFYADHSVYLEIDDNGKCNLASTQAAGVEDLDEATCRRGNPAGSMMYCDFHIQEVRRSSGMIFTTSLTYALVLVKDINDCSYCEQ